MSMVLIIGTSVLATQQSSHITDFQIIMYCVLTFKPNVLHPQRPRGCQSGQEKTRNSSFQAREWKNIWVQTLTGPFPKWFKPMLAPDWAQNNALYYCAQSAANSVSRVLFVSLYMTAIVSITACLAHAPKKCMQSENFQFDISSPFQNTVYPKTKTWKHM